MVLTIDNCSVILKLLIIIISRERRKRKMVANNKKIENKKYAEKLAKAIKESGKKSVVNKTFATSTC